jgi:D-sedoheptulose 7-phosphate isomerase
METEIRAERSAQGAIVSLARLLDETSDAKRFADGYLSHLTGLLQQLDRAEIAALTDELLGARDRGAHIFFIGNGGSAATASHFANDLAIGAFGERPFRAISLCDNLAILTAIANDTGYEQVFVKQLKVLLEPADLVVAISASGNSPNVVKALEYANEKGAMTFALVGFDGGKMKQIARRSVHVKTEKGEYGPVEDVHMVLDHLVSAYLMRKGRAR